MAKFADMLDEDRVENIIGFAPNVQHLDAKGGELEAAVPALRTAAGHFFVAMDEATEAHVLKFFGELLGHRGRNGQGRG